MELPRRLMRRRSWRMVELVRNGAEVGAVGFIGDHVGRGVGRRCAGSSTNCGDEMVACLEAAPACRMSSGMGFCPAMTDAGEPDMSSDAEPLPVPSHLYEAMKTNAATGGLFCEA